MKLLVFSDSHGKTAPMEEMVRLEGPDGLVFLGDMDADGDVLSVKYPHLPLYRVKGNNDWYSPHQGVVEVTLEGCRLFLTHGHLHGVKSGTARVVEAARAAKADVVLFGHTHQSLCTLENGLWVMNPGTVGGYLGSTYGVISLEGGAAYCYISTV